MFSTYRRVLALPGALPMSMSGLVARLPISMIGLGLVVLISDETGSYSLAGAVTASYIVASSLCAIFQARLMDQYGQARVLMVSLTISMLALVLTMVAVEGRARHYGQIVGAEFGEGFLANAPLAVSDPWQLLPGGLR